jgi:hypothetical protein
MFIKEKRNMGLWLAWTIKTGERLLSEEKPGEEKNLLNKPLCSPV